MTPRIYWLRSSKLRQQMLLLVMLDAKPRCWIVFEHGTTGTRSTPIEWPPGLESFVCNVPFESDIFHVLLIDANDKVLFFQKFRAPKNFEKPDLQSIPSGVSWRSTPVDYLQFENVKFTEQGLVLDSKQKVEANLNRIEFRSHAYEIESTGLVVTPIHDQYQLPSGCIELSPAGCHASVTFCHTSGPPSAPDLGQYLKIILKVNDTETPPSGRLSWQAYDRDVRTGGEESIKWQSSPGGGFHVVYNIFKIATKDLVKIEWDSNVNVETKVMVRVGDQYLNCMDIDEYFLDRSSLNYRYFQWTPPRIKPTGAHNGSLSISSNGNRHSVGFNNLLRKRALALLSSNQEFDSSATQIRTEFPFPILESMILSFQICRSSLEKLSHLTGDSFATYIMSYLQHPELIQLLGAEPRLGTLFPDWISFPKYRDRTGIIAAYCSSHCNASEELFADHLSRSNDNEIDYWLTLLENAQKSGEPAGAVSELLERIEAGLFEPGTSNRQILSLCDMKDLSGLQSALVPGFKLYKLNSDLIELHEGQEKTSDKRNNSGHSDHVVWFCGNPSSQQTKESDTDLFPRPELHQEWMDELKYCLRGLLQVRPNVRPWSELTQIIDFLENEQTPEAITRLLELDHECPSVEPAVEEKSEFQFDVHCVSLLQQCCAEVNWIASDVLQIGDSIDNPLDVEELAKQVQAIHEHLDILAEKSKLANFEEMNIHAEEVEAMEQQIEEELKMRKRSPNILKISNEVHSLSTRFLKCAVLSFRVC